MKILHIIESLEIGGAEMVVVKLANSMAGFHEVSICCVKTTGPLVERLNKGIKVYCLSKKEGNDLRIPFKIARLVRKGDYNVVHSHNWGIFFDAIMGARLGGAAKILHTSHGNFLKYPETMRGQINRRIRWIMDRFALLFLDQVVTVSLFIKKQITDYFYLNPEKIEVIYNGIEVPSPQIRTPHKKSEKEDFIFVFVGRIAAVKNLSMMLRALAELIKNTDKRISLWIIGDGPEKTSLEDLSKNLKIFDKVKFWGFRNDIKELLNKSDVFMLTSHYEGISIALLEAMASSIPAIVTDVGGNGEIIRNGKNGFLVPDNDVEACFLAMKKITDNHTMRIEMAQNARKTVNDRFSLESSVESYFLNYSKKSFGKN